MSRCAGALVAGSHRPHVHDRSPVDDPQPGAVIVAQFHPLDVNPVPRRRILRERHYLRPDPGTDHDERTDLDEVRDPYSGETSLKRDPVYPVTTRVLGRLAEIETMPVGDRDEAPDVARD